MLPVSPGGGGQRSPGRAPRWGAKWLSRPGGVSLPDTSMTTQSSPWDGLHSSTCPSCTRCEWAPGGSRPASALSAGVWPPLPPAPTPPLPAARKPGLQAAGCPGSRGPGGLGGLPDPRWASGRRAPGLPSSAWRQFRECPGRRTAPRSCLPSGLGPRPPRLAALLPSPTRLLPGPRPLFTSFPGCSRPAGPATSPTPSARTPGLPAPPRPVFALPPRGFGCI